MQAGDICEVVGVDGVYPKYSPENGDRCKIIEVITPAFCICEFGDDEVKIYYKMMKKNLRPISEFKRGDRVVCGDFEAEGL